MNQETIADLLREAAEIERSKESNENAWRVNRIQVWLGNDVIDERFKPLLNSLYVDAIQNRAAYLPLLLPVLAMLCGNQHGGKSTVSKVDWEHVDREIERFIHDWQKAKESEVR